MVLMLLGGCGEPATDAANRAQSFDLVLAGGRVMDPESGLDAVRNVGIREGVIAAVSETPLEGARIIDAGGLVVAPGFIDLHAHGQSPKGQEYQAHDGVTTSLELEIGVYPVAPWYLSMAANPLINYGASASHTMARVTLKTGVEVGNWITNRAVASDLAKHDEWIREEADEAEIGRLVGFVESGLEDGALGIGMGIQYTPAARRLEILEMFRLAAARGATVFVHQRYGSLIEPDSIAAAQEVLANAAATGAGLHLCHVPSIGIRQTPVIIDMFEAAAARGLDVSTEAYPYTAASTAIGTAIFDEGWQERVGISYGDLQLVETGERLDAESFARIRREQPGAGLVVHFIAEEMARYAVAHPFVMIASDGVDWVTGLEHPRGAGTFSRVLGRYVREEQALDLMMALAKMTIMPARRLESYVPQMRAKGRLSVGADADITVFDAARIIDRATFEEPMQYSDGIEYVIVNGVPIIEQGRQIEGVFPGRAIRRTEGTQQ